MKALTLRLDDATHERLRRQAFDQRTTITELVRDALTERPEATVTALPPSRSLHGQGANEPWHFEHRPPTVTATEVREAARVLYGQAAADDWSHYLRGGQTSAEWARGASVPTVTAEQRARLIALTYASDDGTEYEHDHDEQDGGAPDCPACWAGAVRAALGIEVQP